MARTPLVWSAPPAADPEAIAWTYVKGARGIPGVLRVWADIRDGRLRIVTLIAGHLDLQRKVHEVELGVLRAWPDAPIEFTLLWKGDQLPSGLSDEDLVHSSSP